MTSSAHSRTACPHATVPFSPYCKHGALMNFNFPIVSARVDAWCFPQTLHWSCPPDRNTP